MSNTCCWSQDDFDDRDLGAWDTDCGEKFYLIEETPVENGMVFCCYCGKKMTVSKYQDQPDGEHF